MKKRMFALALGLLALLAVNALFVSKSSFVASNSTNGGVGRPLWGEMGVVYHFGCSRMGHQTVDAYTTNYLPSNPVSGGQIRFRDIISREIVYVGTGDTCRITRIENWIPHDWWG